jgi:hypothetical protein
VAGEVQDGVKREAFPPPRLWGWAGPLHASRFTLHAAEIRATSDEIRRRPTAGSTLPPESPV